MKEKILRLIRALFPALANGTLVPRFGVVTQIPNPPAGGGTGTPEAPLYAVNVQILTPDGDPDPNFPELRDVPLTLPSAGQGRGIAAFPQIGTVVEVAFAYGMETKPFIRSVLPTKLLLPSTTVGSMRFQLTPTTYIELADSGDITIVTPGQIALFGAKVWQGSKLVDSNKVLSDLMKELIAALATIASHTHPVSGTTASASPNITPINTNNANIAILKGKIDGIQFGG